MNDEQGTMNENLELKGWFGSGIGLFIRRRRRSGNETGGWRRGCRIAEEIGCKGSLVGMLLVP